MKLSQDEIETVIRCSAADKTWNIVTADPRVKLRLKRRGHVGNPDHQLSEPYERYTLPFDMVRFGRKEKRVMSESQRQGLIRARSNRAALVPTSAAQDESACE